jgi:tetratricopeptide (TPR) repeat protein
MAPPTHLDDLYQRGWAYYRAGNYERCREATDAVLAADPDNAPCLLLKGMALVELGQAEEALEPLGRATRLAPADADAWRCLAGALLTDGELTEAVAAFRSARRLRPEDVSVLIDLGNTLFMLGHPQEAIDHLEEARRLRPGDRPVLRNLADIRISADRLEEALRASHEILERWPDDILAHCDAAWLNLQLNRPAEAAAVFRTLRRIDPEQAHELYAIHGLVMSEMRQHNWRQALELAIEATRLDRYELTTLLLAYISGKLFGKKKGEITAHDLEARFEAEHREHRRLHAESPG